MGKSVVLETVVDGDCTFECRMVPCGNKRCKSCPHGPYWYQIVWRNKRRCSIYRGKDQPVAYTSDVFGGRGETSEAVERRRRGGD